MYIQSIAHGIQNKKLTISTTKGFLNEGYINLCLLVSCWVGVIFFYNILISRNSHCNNYIKQQYINKLIYKDAGPLY